MHYCGLDVSRKSTHVYIEDAHRLRLTGCLCGVAQSPRVVRGPLLQEMERDGQQLAG
jgi:hypothetical protein